MMELVRWPNQTSRDPSPTLALADSITFSKATRPAKATIGDLPRSRLPTTRPLDRAKLGQLSRNGTDGQGRPALWFQRSGSITVKGMIRAVATAPGHWEAPNSTVPPTSAA
jgi:hypothetical protein